MAARGEFLGAPNIKSTGWVCLFSWWDRRPQGARVQTFYGGDRRAIRSAFLWSTTFVLIASVLGACSSNLDGSGLAPQMSAADVKKSTENQARVMESLVIRAGLQVPPLVGPGNWYPVTLAGFGYVDEKCNAFVDDLFRADRAIRAGRNELNDISNAVAAILSYTTASRNTIGLVATSFGLASKSLDNYQILRLVNLGPAKVQTFVKKSQNAYRIEAEQNKSTIYATQPDAMDAIAGYIDLCRVPTIVSYIDSAIENTDIVADNSAGPSTSPRLLLVGGGGDVTERELRENLGLKIFIPKTSLSSVVVQPPPPNRIRTPLTTFEESLDRANALILQAHLCVKDPTGDLGREGSPTRKAILDFEMAIEDRGLKIVPNGKIDSQRGYNDIINSDACINSQFKNSYEKFLFPTNQDIQRLQERIIRYYEFNSLTSKPAFVKFEIDEVTRNAIKNIQAAENLPQTGELDRPTNNAIIKGAS